MRQPAPKPSPTGTGIAASLIGLVAVVGIFFALAAPFLPHTVDDAYITFRYSRQWAMGAGPYFNPGEHVEGYSNFLLMLVLTPVIRLFGAGAALPAAKAIGLIAAAGALVGSFFMGRRLALASKLTAARATLAGLAAAGLIAVCPGFAVNAVAGLETPLYCCLVTWGAYGLASGSTRGLRFGSLALAAAAITRPEGPLILALAWILAVMRFSWSPAPRLKPEGREAAHVGPSRRDFVAAALVGGAVVGAQVLFRRFHYDGEWLPNTYYAKASGYGDRVAYAWEGITGPFLGAAGLTAAIVGWLSEPRSARACMVAGGVGLVGSLLPLITGGDWMMGYRLVVPYLPLLAAVVAAGWLRLGTNVLRGIPALAGIALLATVPSGYLLQARAREALIQSASLAARGTVTGHAALAEWLRKDARAGDSVALMDIGLIGYRCFEQTVIDLSGLTDRHIAKSPGAFLAKRFDPAYLFEKKPHYLVFVLSAPGNSYAPLPPGAGLSHFSEIEARIEAHADFRRYYVDSLRKADPEPNLFEPMAAAIGAQKVFPYAVPDAHYLLAVFRRRDLSGRAP